LRLLLVAQDQRRFAERRQRPILVAVCARALVQFVPAKFAHLAGQGARFIVSAQEQRHRGGVDPRPIGVQVTRVSFPVIGVSSFEVLGARLGVCGAQRAIFISAGQYADSLFVPMPLLVELREQSFGAFGRAAAQERERLLLPQEYVLRPMMQTFRQYIVSDQWLAQFAEAFAERLIEFQMRGPFGRIVRLPQRDQRLYIQPLDLFGARDDDLIGRFSLLIHKM